MTATQQDLEPGRHRAERAADHPPVEEPGPRRPRPAPTREDARAFRRHQLPPDGWWHTFRLTGDVVAAGTRYEGLIEFWTLGSPDDTTASDRQLAVFWDEQSVPPDARHLHTVITGRLVFHLCERR